MTKNEEILIVIGDNIRALRNARKLSQHDLSIEADIPKNQVGRIERAEINTTIITLQKIAEALEVNLIRLIEFQEE